MPAPLPDEKPTSGQAPLVETGLFETSTAPTQQGLEEGWDIRLQLPKISPFGPRAFGGQRALMGEVWSPTSMVLPSGR